MFRKSAAFRSLSPFARSSTIFIDVPVSGCKGRQAPSRRLECGRRRRTCTWSSRCRECAPVGVAAEFREPPIKTLQRTAGHPVSDRRRVGGHAVAEPYRPFGNAGRVNSIPHAGTATSRSCRGCNQCSTYSATPPKRWTQSRSSFSGFRG
jgi:hypothetical protein